MPYVGRLGAAGIAKETTLGTFVAPTRFIPFIPPFEFNTDIELLESKGIRGIPDAVYKVAQGRGSLKAGKIKFEVEPENIGEHLMAMFGTDTVTGNGTSTPYTHTFSLNATASPPSYSWWQKNGSNFPEHAGCMLNKLDFSCKAGDFLIADAEWIGINYTTGGSTQSLSYSARVPFKFNMAVMSVAGGTVNNYSNFKLTFDRMIEPEWVLGTDIYAAKIFSKGFRTTLSLDFVFEDTTEWTKFINGTSVAVIITITSTEAISGISPTAYYKLTFNVPVLNYSAAPISLPDGLIRIPFVGTAVYDTATSKTANAVLVNSLSASF